MHRSICLLLTILILLTLAPTAGAQSPVSFFMEPQTLTVTPNADLIVTILVDSGSQPLDGVQLTATFDKTFLMVQSLTPGDTMSDVFEQGYSNDLGQITYAAGKMFGSPPSGRFEVVRVRFRAQTETTGTAIQFSVDAPLVTKAVSGGQNLPVTLTGSVIVISQSAATPTPTSSDTPGTAGSQPTETSTGTAPTATVAAYPGPITGTPVATATTAAEATPTETTPAETKPRPTLASPSATTTPSPHLTPEMLSPSETPTAMATETLTPSEPSATPSSAPTITATVVVPPAPTATPLPAGGSAGTGTRILAVVGMVVIAALALGFAFARRHWLSP